MHTSTGVDNVDEFAETIVQHGPAAHSYRYGERTAPGDDADGHDAYRKPDGTHGQRAFTDYAHAPRPDRARRADGKWIACALMGKPIPALEQSWLRTKTQDLACYLKVADLQANSSNDTLFADTKGEIAYLHPAIHADPRRPLRLYQGRSTAATRRPTGRACTRFDELPQAVNPPNGWAYNTNDWPWPAAGADSPKAADYPRYMDQVGENARGAACHPAADRAPRLHPADAARGGV